MGPYTFKIGDTKGFTAYSKGGICTQVKMPTDVTFQPLQEALDNPNELFMLTDFGKFDRPGLLHLAFQTMHKFKKVIILERILAVIYLHGLESFY